MYFSLIPKISPDIDIVFHASNCKRFELNSFLCSTKSFNFETDCCPECFLIEKVSDFQYLGVSVDQTLSWSTHISRLKSYLRSTVRYFYGLRKICSNSTLKTLYYTLVHSKLQYGITCWGGASFNKIQQLLTIQKCIIRKICNVNRLHHTMELFSVLGILPIKHLYFYKCLKIFFIRCGYLHSQVSDTYNLRKNLHGFVAVQISRTTHFKNFYTIVSCKAFNALPAYIRAIRNLPKFLSKVKLFLLELSHDDIKSFLSSAT